MKLQAHKRSETDNAAELRANGSVPAICYGPDLENPISLAVQETEFIKTYRQTGRSTIIDLDIDGEEHETLVKDIDYHPVSDNVQHIDFYEIKRGQELVVDVELVFVGEAPAEKQGLVVNQVMHSLSVTCLPRNLVQNIEVDLSGLEQAGDSITVADIQAQVGETLTIGNEAEAAVVSISEAAAEVEEATNQQAGCWFFF